MTPIFSTFRKGLCVVAIIYGGRNFLLGLGALAIFSVQPVAAIAFITSGMSLLPLAVLALASPKTASLLQIFACAVSLWFAYEARSVKDIDLIFILAATDLCFVGLLLSLEFAEAARVLSTAPARKRRP